MVFVSTLFVPIAANADLQNEYQYGQQSQKSAQERCNSLKLKGNYTRPGGGSWEPEFYVDNSSVYQRTSSSTCDYEWRRVASLDVQSTSNYNDGVHGTCSQTYLFRMKGSDLLAFRKSDCFIGSTNGQVERLCYVPIDWQRGQRKYPYCGCFDTPVESWLTSSGYCRNT